MAFFLTFFMSTWFTRENARRDRAALENSSAHTAASTQAQMALERELADHVPWFRYTA